MSKIEGNIKKNKIIHIYERTYNSYFPGTDSPYYYLAGWASNIARNVLKYEDNQKYIMEVWRFEKEIKKPESKIVNNINCRLFPAKAYPLIGLWSFNIIKAIKKERHDYNLLLHLHTGYNIKTYLYSLLFKKLPIIVSNYGTYLPIFSFRKTKKIKYIIKYIILQLIFRIAVRYYDYFIASGKNDREYLLSIIKDDKVSDFTGIGIDFSIIRPVDKIEARKKLGIPLDKKVLVYVGKMYKVKGVHHIIKAYNELKEEYNLKLILIGASPEQPLCKMAIESGAEVLPRKDRDRELPLYYSAADVYLMAIFDDIAGLNCSGIGIAPLECMGCNTPVVSPSLKHFPEEDLDFVGNAPKILSDFTTNIKEILDNPELYKGCRKYAEKHFSDKIITKKTVRTYDKLFSKYYEVKFDELVKSRISTFLSFRRKPESSLFK